jgi:hypothetical protein
MNIYKADEEVLSSSLALKIAGNAISSDPLRLRSKNSSNLNLHEICGLKPQRVERKGWH